MCGRLVQVTPREGVYLGTLSRRLPGFPAWPVLPLIHAQEEGNMRVKVTLACTECKQRNYNTFKNKKNDPDRIEFQKYCRFCRKHTLHKEAK